MLDLYTRDDDVESAGGDELAGALVKTLDLEKERYKGR